MTSREQFEKYAADRLGLPVEMIFDARNGDRYLHAFDSMNVMQPLNGWWGIWQASRQAVEIEIPERHYFCDNDGAFVDVSDVIYEIQHVGLKVKV